MGLISSRDMTATQFEQCCRDELSAHVLGYVITTFDGQRVGLVDDVLVDDEAFDIRYVVVDTSTAAFLMNKPRILLPMDLCCVDAEHKTVRSEANVAQVQNAPAYDRALAMTRAYEETVFTNFGEHPYWPT